MGVTYMQMGSMLTLQSNGYGYNRRYRSSSARLLPEGRKNWFVMGLKEVDERLPKCPDVED